LIRRLDYQRELSDADGLADSLAVSGLSPEGCRRKARLFARADAALPTPHVERPPAPHVERPRAFFVPGRIEVLGKHTDYAGGSSMVAAAERGFCLVVWPRDDNRVTVTDATRGETIRFALDAELMPRCGHWSNYPMTVARRIARNFTGPLRGGQVAFASDLPPAAGMSSSSAMIVAFYLAWHAVNQLADRHEFRANIAGASDLAGYLATVENGQGYGTLAGDRGVGTFGGSEDHTAILCARPGRVSQYAYCPVRFEREIRLPPGCVFAVGTSGVVAEKTRAAMEQYNAASRRASELASLWRQKTGRHEVHLAAALAAGPEAAKRLARIVESAAPEADRPALSARLEHFVIENEAILPAAGDALAAGDLATFGTLVDRSQHAAERLLGNQVPETIHLAAAARRCGAAAASAFGAGFGGSVWALVEASAADEFLAAWSRAYQDAFPQHARAATFFVTAAGPAAFELC